MQKIRPDKGRESSKLPQFYAVLKANHVAVYCPFEGHILVSDNEGKGRQRPINPLATATAIGFETYPLDQYALVNAVAGPVLLMKSNLMH